MKLSLRSKIFTTRSRNTYRERAMQYQDRIRIAASVVTDFLRQYQRPSHLDNDAALREISTIAEEVNALASTSLSPEDFKARIIEACRQLRKTYMQRTWPTPAHFIKAMELVAIKANRTVTRDDPVTSLPTSSQLVAKRIIDGEPVGDSWLYGKMALQLLSEGLVSQADIDRYRDGLRKSAEEVYSQGQVAEMFERLENRHADAIAVAAGKY